MALRARAVWLAIACSAAFNPAFTLPASAHDRDDFRIEALSAKPHLVSGGDVLVRVTLPDRLDRHEVRVELNGRNINSAFRSESRHTLVGLVQDLKLGRNEIEVSRKGHGRAERLVVTNWPITGPITSGPHQDPFICQTHQFLLPDGTPYTATPAAQPDCSAPTRITYMYMPVGGTALVPLPSTTTLPANVAMTTTTAGQTVRFIVRVETSTVDRGIYQSAVLHDPTVDAAPSPFSPPRGWNRRLIAVEGFGCPGGWYIQGAAIGSLAGIAGMDFALLSPARLGEGYAMFSNTLQHPSNNCNSVLAGEAAMMSKERFIETYGVPRYTVSAGFSGGSYGSIQLADQLPGLFDGALIACTFPDPLSIAFSGSDGHLLANYFAANPAALTNAQKTAITGYKSTGADGQLAFIDAARQSGRTDPVAGRVSPGIPGYVSAPFNANVPAAERYHPVTNPRGARGTVYDASRNAYGIDERTGFALRPFDNVGVQYGLGALNAGAITPKQFLDLNEGIGGFDQDANPVAARSVGSTGAIRRAYQSGLQFVGSGGLASIPLVDISGIYNDDSGYHYQWFHFATRDRMEQANGDTRNHVMWRGNVPFNSAWSMFIAWVEAVANDERRGSAHDKVARNRPGNAVDGCWRTATEFIAERQTFGSTPDSTCNTLFPSFAFPRYVAGGPLAANILKCRLERVERRDYDVAFSAAEFERLKRIFPDGVCDWSKRGVAPTEVVEWGSFGPSRDNLVFDVTD